MTLRVAQDYDEPVIVPSVPINVTNLHAVSSGRNDEEEEDLPEAPLPPSFEYAISTVQVDPYDVPQPPIQDDSTKKCDSFFSKAFVCMALLVVAGIAYLGVLAYQQRQAIQLHDNAFGSQDSTTPSIENLEEYFDYLLTTLEPEIPAIQNPTTPAFEALEWMAFNDGGYGRLLEDPAAIRQRYVLILLYFSTGGVDFWDKQWLAQGRSECDFEGVNCNDDDKVTELDLKSRSLVGPLPPQISWLEELQVLELRGNRLSGTLPQEILTNCKQLQVLELAFNRLIGPGPQDLSALSNLERVNLQGNTLTGSLPRTLPASLKTLILNQNDLSGSIPETWFGHDDAAAAAIDHQLDVLDLAGNQRLNGTLPSGMEQWTNLRSFSISTTKISGTLPSEVGKIMALEEFSVANSKLYGALPSEFYQLTSLQWIVAGSTDLEGTLSTEIGKLTDLQVVQLSSTLLSGTIPTEIGNLSKLEWLQISNTRFTGSLPTELGRLSLLSRLWFYDTGALEGIVPESLCHSTMRTSRLDFKIGCRSSIECSCCGDCV